MKIVLTGGGTGGHITPTLAVAHELKRLQPNCKIVYIIERNAKFADLVTSDKSVDEVHFIFAGKLRRYSGESWLHRLTDVKTMFFNVRDIVFLTLGLVQSVWLIGRIKPDEVFVKGGYVGLPVGAAAAFWHRPIITHDSDTVPGLTNRIVSRWARIAATAFPESFYNYPKAKIRYVGVPLSDDFTYVTDSAKRLLRETLSLPQNAEILFITGGSQGAVRLNEAAAAVVPKLLTQYPKLYVVHQTGKGKLDIYGKPAPDRVMVREFVQPFSAYSGAADLVVARPGANTIAELAAQGRACIIVPNPFLADGHQTKNAEHLVAQGAVGVAYESANLQADLLASIQEMIENPKKAEDLGQKLHKLFRKDAAKAIAMLLLEGKH